MSTDTHVIVDATAVPDSVGGVGRYLEGLVPRLRGDGWRVTIVTRDSLADTVFADLQGVAVHRVRAGLSSAPRRLLWEQTGLPRLARRLGADVIHSPHYTVPVFTRIPRVVTFHDGTFFSDPTVHSRAKRIFFRGWTRLSARLAAGIVVPSQATADDISSRVPLDESRVVVAHHGVDTEVFHPPADDEVARVRALLDLGDAPFIAFLGTLEPRKNVPALVRAFGTAFASADDRPVLVLAGARGWDDTIDAAVAELPAHSRVVVPGYLPLDLLPALLGGADVVAYPSLGEGFGLPVLEALACGACVLTTPRLSLPEVGGDHVEYSEPDDVALASALTSLFADAARRAELRAGARPWAALFTWERSAERHREAYRSAHRLGR